MATDVTIAQAAKAAGFTGQDLVTSVAVALAESGGVETATNHNSDGTTDYGLWQINSVHPNELKFGDWRDPTVNAKMAYSIFKAAGGWSPWVAWKKNRHALFMTRATLAVSMIGDSPVPGAGGTSGSTTPVALTGNVDTIEKFFAFVKDPNNWRRAAFIVTGSVLLIVAFSMLLSETGVYEAGAKVVGTVKKVAGSFI